MLALAVVVALLISGGRGLDDAYEEEVTRIAFGSCAKQLTEQPIWRPIRHAKPDIWIWLGDNIYADVKIGLKKLRGVFRSANEHRSHELYAIQKNVPGYREMRKEVKAVLGTWDDHDYGLDGAGKEFIGKTWSQQALLDFLDVPEDSPRRKRHGVYSSAIFGPEGRRVKVIMLDTRYDRDPYYTDGAMLGEEQWEWLERELRTNPSQVTVLGSSVQFLPDYGANFAPLSTVFRDWLPVLESWTNFPSERRRMAALLRATNTSGAMFLSGDVHFGEIMAVGAGCLLDYPLIEVTSSGLTHTVWDSLPAPVVHLLEGVGPVPYQKGAYSGLNWGSIVINWETRTPMVKVQLHNERGGVMAEHTVTLDELQPRPGAGAGRHCPDMSHLPIHVRYRFGAALIGSGVAGLLAAAAALLGARRAWRAARGTGRAGGARGGGRGRAGKYE